MQTAYVQALLLVGVLVNVSGSDLVRGTASADGLCTYTFRDVCVSQRMSDVKKLRATVDSQQAQITLLNKVVAAIPHMRTVMRQQQQTIDELKSKIEIPKHQPGGAVYIRWGRKTCPGNGADLLYWGIAGGTLYSQSGGGANYLCLPRDPEWGDKHTAGFRDPSGSYLYGAEYQVYHTNYFSTKHIQYLHDNNVPCAVCLLTSRTTKLMIPAKLTCPNGWTKEYSGYLMAERFMHASSKTYVCVDNAPEVRDGGRKDEPAALFYNVEAQCGSLPCPMYKSSWDITCVVCSK